MNDFIFHSGCKNITNEVAAGRLLQGFLNDKKYEGTEKGWYMRSTQTPKRDVTTFDLSGGLFPHANFGRIPSAMDKHFLGPIEELGPSDTQPSQTPTDAASLAHSDEEEVFTYPTDSDNDGHEHDHDQEQEQDEQFVYPDIPVDVAARQDSLIVSDTEPERSSEAHRHPPQDSAAPAQVPQFLFPSPPQAQTPSHPSPAQLEALSAAASQGDLVLLKKLFATALQGSGLEPFALANDASSRTGFTALHAAASRGYLDIVKWLIEDCGAIPDLEDREGESALHKAALNGHMPIIQYLLANKADVHARDADGWTALHNTCSKGYLDIVRWLCETGGAANQVGDVRGVDLRNKGGWTPLMNAASKGHLPIVVYLLSKQAADPLVRNNWGETAYDVAASVFEVWICEVLQKAEVERWRGTTAPYNPLRVHTCVPLVVYENQRLDTRLKTIAISGGRPKFSPSGLGRHSRPAPFELKLPSPDEDTGVKVLPSLRSNIQLPLASDPYKLPNAASQGTPILEGAERSHFWLSDWHIDDTHPRVGHDGGWQYAQSFNAPDEDWLPEPPPQLMRLSSGPGFVATSLSSPPRNHGRRSSSSSSSSASSHTDVWVRRRRWVRVMRRRLFPPLPFMEPNGATYDLADDGSLIPHASDGENDEQGEEGQELGAMRPNRLSSAQDYVARARYLVGNRSDNNDEARSAVETRRAIAKLERATSELRQGILSDDDKERKIQAEVLLNTYSRELERIRLSAGAQGLLNSGSDGEFDEDNDDNDEDEAFHYPGYSSFAIRAPSLGSRSTERSSRPVLARNLTPDLSQAPDFRVPTREAPQKMAIPMWHAQWERDDAVQGCNDCQRRFSFILRRHCRKCGRIFCDRCSSHRVLLDPSEIVQDPASPVTTASSSSQRVCQSCFDQRNSNTLTRVSSAVERIVVDRGRLMAPGQITRQNSSSQLSDLADCPVCGVNLSAFEDPGEQEAHVRSCLDGGTHSTPQTVKYLVYELPTESALVGVECVICLEEFTPGSAVARLSCFCSFHNACLSSWLQRGRSCPVHTR